MQGFFIKIRHQRVSMMDKKRLVVFLFDFDSGNHFSFLIERMLGGVVQYLAVILSCDSSLIAAQYSYATQKISPESTTAKD